MIQFFFMMWGVSAILQAEERKLTVENINQARQVFTEPAKALDKAVDNAKTFIRAPKLAANNGVVVQKKKPLPQIDDPTRLNGTFRQALRRLRGGSDGAIDSQQIPDIALAAKTYSQDGDKSSALLKIEKRLYFVKPGDRFSINYNQHLHEIKVDQIDLHGVQVTIFPANEIIILR